jgi:Fusaric acid resistance protein-like
MTLPARRLAQLRRLDWARGLRAGLAVAAAMVVCRMLRLPMGWSALGAFEGNIVDNGGPYRVRFASIAMLMGGGSLGAVLASLASAHLAWTLALTAVFSFVITYLRAAGPPFTTSSVIILVVYFVGLDHASASLAGALSQAGLFLGGCAFAAILSLILWPVYPFGHARRVISLCFGVLAQSLAEIDALLAEADAAKDQGSSWTARWFSLVQGFPNRMRSALEAARSSLGSVRARTPARSARGRNLAVLLETADILFSRGLAMVDLAERSAIEGNAEDIAFARQRLAWLREAALLVERGLGDRARLAEFRREGNTLIDAARVADGAADSVGDGAMFAAAFQALQAECAQHLESALDALNGVWTGIDQNFSRRQVSQLKMGGTPLQVRAEQRLRLKSSGPLQSLQENWTFASSALRHALRTSAVCVSSVVLVRAMHLPYGEWMALTAVIVLQPYVAHTWQKSLQRVGGTIAGGLLAALLVVFIRTPEALIMTVCISSFFTLAWFAVDYAWYCFFLTPTFVLLTVHGRHDWRIAGIRAMDTILGAALALVAVKLLWTESEHLRLGEILARSGEANAAYLAAMRRYWSTPTEEKAAANVDILAPARRHAGLANNESEEALERLMMEGTQNAAASVRTEHALAFATYSRRLTQGMVAVALVHPEPPGPEWVAFVDALKDRLHWISRLLRGEEVELGKPQPEALLPAGEEQSQAMRLWRQVEVLEKSAQGIGLAPRL